MEAPMYLVVVDGRLSNRSSLPRIALGGDECAIIAECETLHRARSAARDFLDAQRHLKAGLCRVRVVDRRTVSVVYDRSEGSLFG